MFAFLFDRRSGLRTSLVLGLLALLLFGGGVLVGLNLRWAREELVAEAASALSSDFGASPLAHSSEPEVDKAALPSGETGRAASKTPEAPQSTSDREEDAGSSSELPADWVPETSGAPPPE